MKKPVMLMILDGWGLNDHLNEKNAIRAADTKNFNKFWNEYPHSRIDASGEAVGLPEGQMGNSEVGHLNMGAGRIDYQPLVKISKEIREEKIGSNKVVSDLFNHVKDKGTALHLVGLLSDGGVHSHITHVYGIIEAAKKAGIEKVFIHAILDGRDTPPQSALGFVEALENKMAEIGIGKIASVAGRFYTMDRDKRWERVEKGYDAMVNGSGDKNFSAKKCVEMAYAEGATDEFVKPAVITDRAGNPIATIKNGDGVLCFNFRPDRARQFTRAFVDEKFDGFQRMEKPDIKYVCLTQYDSTINAPVAYPPASLVNTLGEVISNRGMKQLRIAETEKYAHVTFFFNGGKEEPFEGEERILISSPKVATYDLQPEMSAGEVTTALLERLDKGIDDLIIVNYANPDMVGHTGIFDAAVKAVTFVDECVGKVIDKVLSLDGAVLVTADHGNADLMEDPVSHIPFTQHTTNQVPLILVSNNLKDVSLKDGKLCDLAPTILKIMGIEVPAEMDGEILIK